MNKYDVITRAESDIGREPVKQFAEKGFHLLIVDVNEEGLKELNIKPLSTRKSSA